MYSYGKTRLYHFHYLFNDNENDIANEASIAPKIKAGGKKHHKFNEPIEKKLLGMNSFTAHQIKEDLEGQGHIHV
jgi:hypothetical protein